MKKLLIAAAVIIAPFSALTAPAANAAPCGNGAIGDSRMGTPACSACVNQIATHPGLLCTNPADAPAPVPTAAPGQICADARRLGGTC
jgi:hypothetical protein